MSAPAETKLEDTQGKYLYAVRDGTELHSAEWTACRIVLTDERLAMVGEDRVTIPLSSIDQFGGREDVNQAAASEPEYVTVRHDGDAVLVTTPELETLETSLFRALLDGVVVYVTHPAVVGGVVQDESWQRGQVRVAAEAVRIALEDGRSFTIERGGVSELTSDERAVDGDQRPVIEVEHADDRSVETYLSGDERHVSALERFLAAGAERNQADLDLDPIERQVVTALYSGVSPFAIADFVGTDIETVEEIYDRLIELDVIEAVRERSEVSLTPHGRAVASEAMGER